VHEVDTPAYESRLLVAILLHLETQIRIPSKESNRQIAKSKGSSKTPTITTARKQMSHEETRTKMQWHSDDMKKAPETKKRCTKKQQVFFALSHLCMSHQPP